MAMWPCRGAGLLLAAALWLLPAPAAAQAAYSAAPAQPAPAGSFSFLAGKLPTLQGAEDTWSFENMNIERGLLWNQENAVNRGLQANYTAGPLAVSLSWTDGYYSDVYTWLSGSLAWTIDKQDTLTLVGAGNSSTVSVSSTATPLLQNNQQIYNVIFERTAGPWVLEPYFQVTSVPKAPSIGVLRSGSTTGVALLASYSFPASAKLGGLSLAGVSLPVRVEYIGSSGSAAGGSPNLLYGPGSDAWSLSITPTYQVKTFFIRGEFSYVSAGKVAAGSGFGRAGTAKEQARFLLEGGILF